MAQHWPGVATDVATIVSFFAEPQPSQPEADGPQPDPQGGDLQNAEAARPAVPEPSSATAGSSTPQRRENVFNLGNLEIFQAGQQLWGQNQAPWQLTVTGTGNALGTVADGFSQEIPAGADPVNLSELLTQYALYDGILNAQDTPTEAEHEAGDDLVGVWPQVVSQVLRHTPLATLVAVPIVLGLRLSYRSQNGTLEIAPADGISQIIATVKDSKGRTSTPPPATPTNDVSRAHPMDAPADSSPGTVSIALPEGVLRDRELIELQLLIFTDRPGS